MTYAQRNSDSFSARLDRRIEAILSGLIEGIAALAAAVVYFAVWIGAAFSAGWVIGIALGWIPAILAAAITYGLIRYAWWLIPIVGILLYKAVS